MAWPIVRKNEAFSSFSGLIHSLKKPVELVATHSPTARIMVRDDRGWRVQISHTLADRILPAILFDRAKSVILTSPRFLPVQVGSGFSTT